MRITLPKNVIQSFRRVTTTKQAVRPIWWWQVLKYRLIMPPPFLKSGSSTSDKILKCLSDTRSVNRRLTMLVSRRAIVVYEFNHRHFFSVNSFMQLGPQHHVIAVAIIYTTAFLQVFIILKIGRYPCAICHVSSILQLTSFKLCLSIFAGAIPTFSIASGWLR
jgi:hypothetical protein